MKDDLGVYSKHLRQQMNDLDCAIPVFRLGTHSDNEEEAMIVLAHTVE